MIDPLYLSVLCGLFGGGDMNGIALLAPEWTARVIFGVLLVVNGLVFWKRILPIYNKSFTDTEKGNERTTGEGDLAGKGNL